MSFVIFVVNEIKVIVAGYPHENLKRFREKISVAWRKLALNQASK